MAMASSEQPLKKRRLYEPPPEPPETVPQPDSTVAPPTTPPSLSQEEILARRRNRNEIRNIYENYKRIKSCIALKGKDARHMPELEQAYLGLIAASTACSSAKRLIADFIPSYALYCPTALEAATKAIIDVHNSSLAVINSGEDTDSVAFQTAKACSVGLADICCAASAEASTSSVIRGICSTVFQNVLSFFVSCFDGKDLSQIIDDEIWRMQDSDEIYSELKKRISNGGECSLVKLSKLHALSLIRIFSCCPKNLLAACFELFKSSEEADKGLYFLRQAIGSPANVDIDGGIDKFTIGPKSCKDSLRESSKGSLLSGERPGSDGGDVREDASPVQNSSLLGLVFGKNPSLRSWLAIKYKNLCKLSPSKSVPGILSSLEEIFESFGKCINVDADLVDTDEDDSDSSKFVTQSHLMSTNSNQHENLTDQSGRGTSNNESCAENLSGQYLKPHVVPIETHLHASTSSNYDSGGARPMEFERYDHGDLSISRSSVPRDLSSNQMLSPAARTPLDFRSNSFDGRNHFKNVDKNQVPNTIGASALRPSSGGVTNASASPNSHFAASYGSTFSQTAWYFDGDPAAMGVFSASRQLWLGYLGPDASEGRIRFEVERFGPIEQFFFFPIKAFALVEYRNIIDAIRCRDYIRGCFPWRVMFMDIGLGTRGTMNGVAVGYSCHVYVGNISSQWAKDEILHESIKVVYKGPYMVTDLTCECALLLEYETPEEAAAVMAHLRQYRKERSNPKVPFNAGPPNVTMAHTDGGRSAPAPPIPVDAKNNNTSNLPSSSMELVSPNLRVESHGTAPAGAHPFQSNWAASSCVDVPEGGVRKIDSYDNNLVADPAQGGGAVVSGTPGQVWSYKKAETELHPAPGNMPCMPIATQSLSAPQPQPPPPPPPQLQAPPFMRPVYHPPNSSWDLRGLNHQFPQNPISPGVVPNTFHSNAVPPPFIPAPVTPLAQIQGPQIQHFEQMFPHPVAPPPLSSMPLPQPEMPPPPPPPPSPPPPPPPPPPPMPPQVSPPPPPIAESSDMENSEKSIKYQWQGTLCKSGVHYCTINVQRLESYLCKYSNAISEPAEWPAKLDMTKRTDFRHVKSTFTNTPPHKREVCCLIPSSSGDHKGFQDFISYLKQRDCAGVIKIPAMRSMWPRLLFILPYSQETCSMLSVAPIPYDCLIGLVLPKETNFE